MSAKLVALLVLVVALAHRSEQRRLPFVVEGPPASESEGTTTRTPPPGPVVEAADLVVDSAAAPGPARQAMQQVSVASSDVEAITRFLRYHYRRHLLRLFPQAQVDGDAPENGQRRAQGDAQCDPDECYSHCYLQGFRTGKCKENKCFCVQVPTASPPADHGVDNVIADLGTGS